MLFFFSYRIAAHLNLHPFPTRRSSDLRASASTPGTTTGPPAEREYAVEPVGDATMMPSALYAPTSSPSTATRNRTTRATPDRKSTRLNSSHLGISYAVFCLKKKKK